MSLFQSEGEGSTPSYPSQKGGTVEPFECYEFNIQIWFEEGEWNYSVVQEFESGSDTETEALLLGTANSLKDATHAVSVFVSSLDFE